MNKHPNRRGYVTEFYDPGYVLRRTRGKKANGIKTAPSLMLDVVAKYQRAHPHVRVDFLLGTTAEVVRPLLP